MGMCADMCIDMCTAMRTYMNTDAYTCVRACVCAFPTHTLNLEYTCARVHSSKHAQQQH